MVVGFTNTCAIGAYHHDLLLIVIRVMVFNATVFQVYGGGQFY
jgi:hypothetical protein